MNPQSRRIQRTYLTLILGNTLAASFIWGINTLFLLSAGLSNFQAFAANAFFTAGMVLFEVPTGVVADTWGRRASYLMGTATLAASTFLYYLMWLLTAPFWAWAVVSILIGLGFTFFSGAVEAWLVDALYSVGFDGRLESVFGRGQVVAGVAMLVGSVAGGVLAQATSLGVPFLVRTAILIAMAAVAFRLMFDIGFTPRRMERPVHESREILRASVQHGLVDRPVRWLMLSALFTSGVGIYVFYALQPYLLQLYGDPGAYSIAGLAAAMVAGAQIAGGFAAAWVRGRFRRRTTVLILTTSLTAAILPLLWATDVFWVALLLLAVWALVGAVGLPVRQAYLNDMIPSQQRATVLSFDSLMGNTGAVVAQPVLGRAADIGGYGASFLVAAGIQVAAVPFLAASRRERSPADVEPLPPPLPDS